MTTLPSATRYAEIAAPAALSDRLRCSWRFRQGCTPMEVEVLPDGCVDLIWDGSHLFVAGPDRRATQANLVPGSTLSGVRLAAGAGPALLGLPLNEITGQRVDLATLWGAAGRDWQTRLEDGADPLAGLHALCAARQLQPDWQMAWVFSRLAGADALPVAGLAAELGISERSLRRRCQPAFGYGAKTLDRILRLQRFLGMAAHHSTLTAAALESGYGDAAHLVRDSRQLTGRTPGELVRMHAR